MEALLEQHRLTGLAASLQELGVLDLQDLVRRREAVLEGHAHLKPIQMRKLQNLLQAAEVADEQRPVEYDEEPLLESEAKMDQGALEEAYRCECWQLRRMVDDVMDEGLRYG